MKQNKEEERQAWDLIWLIKSMTPEQKNALAEALKPIISIQGSPQTEMTSPKK